MGTVQPGALRSPARELLKALVQWDGARRPRAGEPAPRCRASRWVRLLSPLLVLVGDIAVDLGGYGRFPGLTLLSPALAALLVGPVATTVYTVAAVATTFLLGMYHGFAGGPGNMAASVGMAFGVAVAGAIAVTASRHRVDRETKLENITRVAEVAQHTILDTVPPSMDGLGLAVSYQSASADARIGGDLYEVTDTPWGARLLVGDVRGKGLDAVRLASRVLGCFRVVAHSEPDPARVMAALDSAVARAGGPEDFVTATVAQINPDRLTLINAGHPDPVLLHDGTPELVPVHPRQLPLGLGADGTAATTRILSPGDRLLFYTDGITEARNPSTGEFFPLLAAARAAFGRRTLGGGLAEIVRRLSAWTASTLHDDVALLAVEVTPTPPPIITATQHSAVPRAARAAAGLPRLSRHVRHVSLPSVPTR
jgi:phosphoserine phosphatase RsbU/P